MHNASMYFFFKVANETVNLGEGGDRTVYLLPGDPVALLCQGEKDVLWSKDGQVNVSLDI